MELAVQALVQGILIGGVYALIALGFTVVYNITGVVNMSHGDLLSLAMFLYLSLNTIAGLDPYVGGFYRGSSHVLAGWVVVPVIDPSYHRQAHFNDHPTNPRAHVHHTKRPANGVRR